MERVADLEADPGEHRDDRVATQTNSAGAHASAWVAVTAPNTTQTAPATVDAQPSQIQALYRTTASAAAITISR